MLLRDFLKIAKVWRAKITFNLSNSYYNLRKGKKLSDQINFGALKLCKNIEKLRKREKNTLKIVVLVLLLGVTIHLDLSNHNEYKLNIFLVFLKVKSK